MVGSVPRSASSRVSSTSSQTFSSILSLAEQRQQPLAQDVVGLDQPLAQPGQAPGTGSGVSTGMVSSAGGVVRNFDAGRAAVPLRWAPDGRCRARRPAGRFQGVGAAPGRRRGRVVGVPGGGVGARRGLAPAQQQRCHKADDGDGDDYVNEDHGCVHGVSLPAATTRRAAAPGTVYRPRDTAGMSTKARTRAAAERRAPAGAGRVQSPVAGRARGPVASRAHRLRSRRRRTEPEGPGRRPAAACRPRKFSSARRAGRPRPADAPDAGH